MIKSGIDYFPLDVSMDAKMELIEAEFGLTGFGVVVHLLQEIYGNGFNIKAMKQFDYQSQKWKRKRLKILRRDNYLCQECKRYGKMIAAREVHHIKHSDEYPELAYDDNNLISLCHACHNKQHPEKAGAMRYRY